MTLRNGVKADFRPTPIDPMRAPWLSGRRERGYLKRALRSAGLLDAPPQVRREFVRKLLDANRRARFAAVAEFLGERKRLGLDNDRPRYDRDLWRPEYAHWAYNMALLGATDGEIATALGVSRPTFVMWKAEKWSLMDALARAARATASVGASLYMRAVGFTHPSEKIVVVAGEVKRVETTEYVPPSVEAARYWLENKQPERWRSRQEVTGAGGSPLIPPSGDLNVAVAVLTSGKADANEMSKAYLRIMGTPLPEAGAALPAPAEPNPSEGADE